MYGICTNCDAEEILYADGLLYNPCGNDISFNLSTNCIVHGGMLTGSSTMDLTSNCFAGGREHTVDATRTDFQPVYIGRIAPGDYTLELHFDAPFDQSISHEFTTY